MFVGNYLSSYLNYSNIHNLEHSTSYYEKGRGHSLWIGMSKNLLIVTEKRQGLGSIDGVLPVYIKKTGIYSVLF